MQTFTQEELDEMNGGDISLLLREQPQLEHKLRLLLTQNNMPFIEKKITKKGNLKVIVRATPQNPFIYNPLTQK